MAMNSTEGLTGGAKPKYTFSIDLFRGVDYADNSWEMNEQRSPDMMNMISGENGSIKCRNGYEETLKLDGKINGIYTLALPEGDHILVHHGTRLSRWFDYVEGTYTVPEEGLKVTYSFADPTKKEPSETGGYLEFDDLPFEKMEGDRYGMLYEIEIDAAADAAGRMDVNGKKIPCRRVDKPGGTPILSEIEYYGYCAVITKQMYNEAVAAGKNPDDVYFSGETVGEDPSYKYYGRDNFLSNAGYNSADDLPDEGLPVFYKHGAPYGRIFTYYKNGNIYSTSARDVSIPQFVVDAESKVYQITTPPSFCYYLFSDLDETYSFDGVLSPGDEVDFIFELEKLTINGKLTFLSNHATGTEISLQKESKSILELQTGMADQKSSCQQLADALCIFDGYAGYVYKEFESKEESEESDGGVFEARRMDDEAYVPVIMVGCAPIKTVVDGGAPSLDPIDSGGGPSADSPYEATNLLSDKRAEQFIVTEESTSNTPLDGEGTWYYKLPLSVLPVASVDKVEEYAAAGEWTEVSPTEYSLDKENGVVVFDHSLHVTPLSDVLAVDNYRVTYTVDYSGTNETRTKSFGTLGTDNPQDSVTWEWCDIPRGDKEVPLYHVYLGEGITNTKVSVKMSISRPVYTSEEKEIFPPFLTVQSVVAEELEEQNVFAADGTKVYVRITSSKRFPLAVLTRLRKEGESLYLDITNPYGESHDSARVDWYYYEGDLRVDLTFHGDLYQDRINKAKISTKFGYGGNMDRLFVSGYDEMPEYEFWSEIDNPLYFPDLNYAACGDGDTRIMGWNRVGNNQLAIHKESNGQDPTVYIQRAELNEDYSANFPVTEGATGVGAISERSFAVLNGEPLALSKYGVFETRLVEDIPTDIKYAAPRSFYINPELRKLDLSEAEAISFDNKYFLAVGGKVYIADGNQKYMIGGNEGYDFSYEWYPWDNIPVRVWWAYRGELYFGTADGRILKFNDGFYDLDKPVECYWHSKPINFGQPAYYKKVKNMSVTLMPAEWCEVNIDYITGSMNKTVRTQSIHSDDNLPVTIPTNYKAKRIQDIQFKIWGRNAEPLEMINLTVLYTIGGRYKGM